MASTSRNNPKLSAVKWVSPQIGRLYTITKLGVPKKTFCLSLIKGTKADAMVEVFPYGFGKFKLTWSKLITRKQFETEMKEDRVTPKYDSFRDFLEFDMGIGSRTEEVLSFKEIEDHPFVVESLSAVDGVPTEIIVTLIVEIGMPKDGGPLKILGLLPDPFRFIFSFINAAIVSHANDHSSKELRRMKKGDKSFFEAIKINGVYYLDYLNDNVFNKFEIKVTNVNLEKVVLAKSADDVLQAEQDVVIAEDQKKKRLALNVAKDAENKTALALYEGKTKANTDFIVNSAAGMEKINGAYGKNNPQLRTLIIGGENNKLLTDFIAALEASKS